MLDGFIEKNREELIVRARKKVATRSAPRPTEKEIKYGVPLFLKQLQAILRAHPQVGGTPHVKKGANEPEVSRDAALHGGELLRMGLTVGQVVHAYGDVCQAITELAVESGAPLGPADFHTLNRCLDDAIAAAVTEYVRQHDSASLVAQSAKEVERLGVFAHELRNLINTGVLALEALKSGRVGISGSTGAVLERTLGSLKDLVDRSLSEVRLASGAPHRSVFRAAALIEEVEISATMDARSRGSNLVVEPVNFEWLLDGDRQLLASALANLLQNALKFSKPGSQISLRTSATPQRIAFEVEDQCGGLSPQKIEGLFRPFVQGDSDRSGLGLGLTISRRAVEANGGKLTARNVPGKGCVFVVDLPMATQAT